jgi:LmbE family N-acetylglucosaminyl deacetylase
MKKNWDIVVFSPHMDDAVFSMGSILLEWIHQGKSIKIISVFTEFSLNKYSSNYAKKLIEESGCKSAKIYTKIRQEENMEAMKQLGVAYENWGINDGGFRASNKKPIYMNFKQLMSGKISRYDKKLCQLIAIKMKTVDAKVVVAPLGWGGHADHIIVSKEVKKHFEASKTLFFVDMPYFWTSFWGNIRYLLRDMGLVLSFRITTSQKNKMAMLYKTQYYPIIRKFYYLGIEILMKSNGSLS